MAGTILWLVLLAAAAALELAAHRRGSNVATLPRVIEAVATRLAGRVILLGFWIFVGLHLFARYTLPGR